MSKKIKFTLDKNGVRALLKSDGIAAVCQSHASNTLQRWGAGYEMEQRNYPERTGYIVRAATYQAKKDALKNNTLLKAVK